MPDRRVPLVFLNSISFYDTVRAPFAERRLATLGAFTRREDATMRRVKRASRKKRTTKAAAVTVLGAAGVGLSPFGSTSGSTMPTADIPQSDKTSPNQRFVLGEEEMQDVSLATFHLLTATTAATTTAMAATSTTASAAG